MIGDQLIFEPVSVEELIDFISQYCVCLLCLVQESVRTVWRLLSPTAPSPVLQSWHTATELDLPNSLENKVCKLLKLCSLSIIVSFRWCFDTIAGLVKLD